MDKFWLKLTTFGKFGNELPFGIGSLLWLPDKTNHALFILESLFNLYLKWLRHGFKNPLVFTDKN